MLTSDGGGRASCNSATSASMVRSSRHEACLFSIFQQTSVTGFVAIILAPQRADPASCVLPIAPAHIFPAVSVSDRSDLPPATVPVVKRERSSYVARRLSLA